MQVQSGRNLKSFAYISDSKLRALHGQLVEIPSDRKLEWKMDIKVASLTGSLQQKESEQSRESKLKAVVDALESQGQIGTIHEPLEYFRGSVPMRWGIFQDQRRPENEPPLVYFGAFAGDTILGLGGSTRHVLGSEGISSTTSRSATPFLVHHLLSGLGLPDDGWDSFKSYDDSEGMTYQAIVLATSQLRGPTFDMEFVAKTLVTGSVRHQIVTRGERRKCLLGTPLYVAFGRPMNADPWQKPWVGE